MSAFVVEDETINQVVSFLARCPGIDWMQRILAGQGYDVRTSEGQKKLANDMFALNVNAVNAPYNEQSLPRDFSLRLTSSFSTMSAYKRLECWLYQCAEGDTPRESALYKLMCQIKGCIAEKIVSELPEYNQAPWK